MHSVHCCQRTLHQARPCAVVTHRGLVQSVDGFSQRVGVRIAPTSDQRSNASLLQTRAGAQRHRLRAPVRLMGHPFLLGPRRDGLLQCIQNAVDACPHRHRPATNRYPTIRRANTSITTATSASPCQVWTTVKSLSHRAFGWGAQNGCFPRSCGQGEALSLTEGRTTLPRMTPHSPS